MLWLVALWSAAEAAIWSVIADVPISVVAVRRGWKSASIAAVIAALASIAGAVPAWWWASRDPAGIAATYATLPAIEPTLIAEAARRYAGGLSAVILGSFQGIPFKLFVLEGARRHEGWILFAAPLVRLPRFLLSALATAAISRLVTPRLGPRSQVTILATFWTLFYGWYWLH